MAKIYKLYGRSGSGSLAVQIALEEIGAKYERIWVSRDPHEVDKLRTLHPAGKVPVLILPDGTAMFESAAMLMHLAHANKELPLAPAPGSSLHALFLQWMVFLSANVYESALRMYYPSRYTSRGESDADVVRTQGARDFFGHLDMIARALKPYVLGDAYSIADSYLYMLANWYVGDKAELFAQLPSLGTHAKLIEARPAVAKVEADHAQ